MKDNKMKRILLPILISGVLLLGACGAPTVSEPEIPANYTTYTDETGLFSISYPSDWEHKVFLTPELDEEAIRMVTESIEADSPLEESYTVFYARPSIVTIADMENTPTVFILVLPLPEGMSTHDEAVETLITENEQILQDYHYYEFSRIKTTVDGKEATIIDWEATIPSVSEDRFLVIYTLTGKTVWSVVCSSPQGEFSEWEEDFQTIVRSLRILN
jgi:hypothetical protein